MKKLAGIALAATLSLAGFAPMLHAQQVESKSQAKAEQDAYDKEHHNTAKTVGGTAAGGAVIGAAAGGPVGAVVGGAAGAGVGKVADKIRKHHGVKKREKGEGKPLNQ